MSRVSELGDGAPGAHALGLEPVVRAPGGALALDDVPPAVVGQLGAGVLGIRGDVGGDAQHPAGRQPRGDQVEGVLLHEPPLGVLVLRPRVGEEQVHGGQGCRGDPVGEERQRVPGVHPQVRDAGRSAAASIRATPGTCTSTATRSASGWAAQ